MNNRQHHSIRWVFFVVAIIVIFVIVTTVTFVVAISVDAIATAVAVLVVDVVVIAYLISQDCNINHCLLVLSLSPQHWATPTKRGGLGMPWGSCEVSDFIYLYLIILSFHFSSNHWSLILSSSPQHRATSTKRGALWWNSGRQVVAALRIGWDLCCHLSILNYFIFPLLI